MPLIGHIFARGRLAGYAFARRRHRLDRPSTPSSFTRVAPLFPKLDLSVHTAGPPAPLPPCRWIFPNPESAPRSGLVAVGGDFEPATVLAAYRRGIFPWPHDDEEHLWFSPDPRAVLPLDGLHVPRRLARRLRQGRFHFTVDAAFAAVLDGCADRPEGTWITPGYRRGYLDLHRLGWAHSVEAWDGDTLAGGLYGVRVGRLFGAESMFHRVTDASKAALVAFVQWCRDEGIELVDVQVATPHTRALGVVEIPRADYLRRLAHAIAAAEPAPRASEEGPNGPRGA